MMLISSSKKLLPHMKDLLPIIKEKYISSSLNIDSTKNDLKNCVKLRFIDLSLQVSSSRTKSSFFSKDKLWILQCKFSNLSEENFNLLPQKGVFPYEYIDCVEKLKKRLSSRESFYSSLTEVTILENAYARRQRVAEVLHLDTQRI